jgi:Ran GTPase-activating protein (RanGAP) involved in mRNA processing and transport
MSDIIAKFFETDLKIKNLNLSACHLGLGCKTLMTSLEKNTKIGCLDLSVNDIGGNKNIFDSLSKYLKKNLYIKYLYLDGNFINDKDFEKLIVEGIHYNKNLYLLSLRSNRITLEKIENKETGKNIREIIKINNHIKNIRLDGNPIKNEKNLNLLNEALEKNGTLENIENI